MSNLNTPQMLSDGTVLNGRYCIERYIASGSIDNTYEAIVMRFNCRVAVKEFYIRSVNHRSADNTTVEVGNAENREAFLTRQEEFRRKARLLFSSRNDLAVHVIDLFDANGTSYYVMDLIEGEGGSPSQQEKRGSQSQAEVRTQLVGQPIQESPLYGDGPTVSRAPKATMPFNATLNNGAVRNTKQRSSNKCLYAVVGILLTAVVAMGVFLFIRTTDDNTVSSAANTAVVTDGEQSKSTASANVDDTEIPTQEETTVQNKPTSQEPSYVRLPSEMAFNGTINGSKMNYVFSMYLFISDNGNVNGYYVVHNGKQERVNLTGNYNAGTNVITFYEMEASTGRRTGYFFDASLTSSYSSGYSITGRYKCNKPIINWYFSAETN